jgi:hypothetical protein
MRAWRATFGRAKHGEIVEMLEQKFGGGAGGI